MYEGPSIMVRTITSPNGGIFSVWIDGYNTSSNIDTFSHQGNTSLPICYPLQFPPFAVTPPGYENRTNHTIALIYTGPSINSPEGTTATTAEFDSFAIPDFHSHLNATNNGPPTHPKNFHFHFSLMFTVLVLFVSL